MQVSSKAVARGGYEQELGYDTHAHEDEQFSQSSQLLILCPSEARASVRRTALCAVCRRVCSCQFTKELSFDKLPAAVREHLDSVAVLLE